jgi:hypothetical protein
LNAYCGLSPTKTDQVGGLLLYYYEKYTPFTHSSTDGALIIVKIIRGGTPGLRGWELKPLN